MTGEVPFDTSAATLVHAPSYSGVMSNGVRFAGDRYHYSQITDALGHALENGTGVPLERSSIFVAENADMLPKQNLPIPTG